MIDANYTYRAKVYRIVDGDTVDVDIDVGFHMTSRQRVRLARIDAPEPNSRDQLVRAGATLSKVRLTEILADRRVVLQTKKTDSFGRYLAEIYLVTIDGTQINISDVLLAEGLAVPYK